MKTNVSFLPTVPPPFRPVKIELVFESQAELDALGMLFNHNAVVYALNKATGIEVPPLHEDFKKAGANISSRISELSAALKAFFN